jgi:hypothetical protein
MSDISFKSFELTFISSILLFVIDVDDCVQNDRDEVDLDIRSLFDDDEELF